MKGRIRLTSPETTNVDVRSCGVHTVVMKREPSINFNQVFFTDRDRSLGTDLPSSLVSPSRPSPVGLGLHVSVLPPNVHRDGVFRFLTDLSVVLSIKVFPRMKKENNVSKTSLCGGKDHVLGP